MKNLTLALRLLAIAGCSVESTDESTGLLRSNVEVCWDPYGDYVISPASDTSSADRTMFLQDTLMGMPLKNFCAAPPCNLAETCASISACWSGLCYGWTCSLNGFRVDPDDGRKGAAVYYQAAQVDAEIANPLNTRITEAEKLELAALRATAEPFTNFECWEEFE